MPVFQKQTDREPPERPWYVEFFFDPTKPLALRMGILAAILLFALYPVIAVQLRHKEPPPQPSTDPVAPQPGTAEPSPDSEPVRAPAEEQAGTPGEEGPPEVRIIRTGGSKIDPVFQGIPGLNPLFAATTFGIDSDVWILSSKQVYQFQKGGADKGHLTTRLDPTTWDHVDEMPQLSSIMVAPDGAVWVGAKDGSLLRYFEYDWKTMVQSGEPFKFPIKALITFENKLYIGGQGLWKWDGSKGRISRFPAFKNTNIHTFALRNRTDGPQELLLGADNGVWKNTEKGWVQIYVTSGSDQRAQALLDLGAEGILVGTADGLLRVSPSGNVLERLIPGTEVTAIVRDAKSHLWIGTKDAGLKYWDGTRWFQATTDEGFPGKNVVSLLLDPNGRLWMTVFGKGVYTSQLSELSTFISRHKDTSKIIDARKPKIYSTACKAAVEEIRDGVSGAVSLFRFDGRDYTFFNGRQVCPLGAGFLTPDRTAYLLSGWNLTVATQNGRREIDVPKDFPADQVKKILVVDSQRRVWFGPNSSGPFVMHPPAQGEQEPRFQNIDGAEFQKNPTAFILEDKNGAIWVGSAPPFDREKESFLAPPLHLFDGTNWQHYTPKEGLSSWMLQDATLRSNGSIAIVGDNGLNLIENGTINKVRASDALRKRFMFSVFEDKLGDLWVGHQFFSQGVSFYDSSAFHTITAEQGLFSDRIIAVSQDAMERIWLLASNGTVGIYPRSFFDRKVAEGTEPAADQTTESSDPSAESEQSDAQSQEPKVEEMRAPPPDEALDED